MRIGDPQKIRVDDATFLTDLRWGELKKLQAELKALPDEDEDANAHMLFIEAKLLKYIVGCEGLENEQGEPIEKLTKGILNELHGIVIKRIFAALYALGEATEAVDAAGNG